MIRGIVFDLDDTLISEYDYVRSGFDATANYIVTQNLTNQTKQNVYKLLVELFTQDAKCVFNRCLAELKIKETSELITQLIHTYRAHLPNIELLPDAKYILNILREQKIPLAMITDGYQITQQQKLKALNIASDFQTIIITDELGREFWKPHAKPYELVQQQLQIPFEELVYIGDNVTKDFVTAKKLGMKTIQICRQNSVYSQLEMSEEYQADFKITSLVEIEKIL